MIIKCVCPENHTGTTLHAAWAAAIPCFKGLRGESRHPALRRDAAQPFHHLTDSSRLREQIGHTGHHGGQSRPPIDQAHRIRVTGTQAPLIVMRGNSALYVAISTLTGQSPLQPLHARHRSSDALTCSSRHPFVRGSPRSISNRRRRPPARRVHLFMRDPIAWTHRTFLLASALAHSHAANRGPCEATVIAWKLKVRRRLGRTIVRPQSKVLIDPIGVHDFSRIHFCVRIPDAFKLPKGLHQRGREHARE